MVDTSDGNKQIEARYANYFRVGHTGFEIVLDFGQHYSGEQGPDYHTRIITNPAYASSLLRLLEDSLKDDGHTAIDPNDTDSRYE